MTFDTENYYHSVIRFGPIDGAVIDVQHFSLPQEKIVAIGRDENTRFIGISSRVILCLKLLISYTGWLKKRAYVEAIVFLWCRRDTKIVNNLKSATKLEVLNAQNLLENNKFLRFPTLL